MTLKSITNFRLDNVRLTFEERETINFEDHYETEENEFGVLK